MSDTNERLNELLIKQIERFDGAADKAIDFAAEQAPDLVNQLLLWHGVKSAIVFTLLAAVVVFTCVCYCKFWAHAKTFEDPYFSRAILGLLALTCIVTLTGGMSNSIDWLQILIAPKLYLMEYAAGLVA